MNVHSLINRRVINPLMIERVLNTGVVAVTRAQSSNQLVPVAKTLYETGVIGMEAMMTTPKTPKVFSNVNNRPSERIPIGVGIVLAPNTISPDGNIVSKARDAKVH